jgi:hypothetical protein
MQCGFEMVKFLDYDDNIAMCPEIETNKPVFTCFEKIKAIS